MNSQATMENIIRSLGGEEWITREQVDAIVLRVLKRIPNFNLVQNWLEDNPWPGHESWEMYCISGFNMPPHPKHPDVPAFVNNALGKIFMWICVTDICGPNGPFTFTKVREAYGY